MIKIMLTSQSSADWLGWEKNEIFHEEEKKERMPFNIIDPATFDIPHLRNRNNFKNGLYKVIFQRLRWSTLMGTMLPRAQRYKSPSHQAD